MAVDNLCKRLGTPKQAADSCRIVHWLLGVHAPSKHYRPVNVKLTVAQKPDIFGDARALVEHPLNLLKGPGLVLCLAAGLGPQTNILLCDRESSLPVFVLLGRSLHSDPVKTRKRASLKHDPKRTVSRKYQ